MRFEAQDMRPGCTFKGYVMSYNAHHGYGFITTTTGKDVLLSSWQLGKKLEKQMVFGAYVEFQVENLNDHFCATHIQIIDRFPHGETFTMPHGKEVRMKDIFRIGLKSGADILELSDETLQEHNLTRDDLQFLYITLQNQDEYRYFSPKMSMIQCDGHLPVMATYCNLKKQYCPYDEETIKQDMQTA